MSQRLKTLSLLRHAGERGVTNSEFIDWRIFRYMSEPDDVERTVSSPDSSPGARSLASPADGSLSADVDDGRRGDSQPGSSFSSPAANRVAPAAVVNTDTLFPVEHEPRSPYEYEDAA